MFILGDCVLLNLISFIIVFKDEVTSVQISGYIREVEAAGVCGDISAVITAKISWETLAGGKLKVRWDGSGLLNVRTPPFS